MNAFERAIKSIADWTIKTPTFYGWFHILWLCVTAAACTLIFVFRRKISPKAVRITLIVWGALLILLEVIKQLTVSFHCDGESVFWSYPWWAFPFQLCSSPLYVALPAGLLKKGKIKDALQTFLATYALFGGLVAMLYPANMFTPSGFLSFHTMLWHSSMVSICFMLLATRTVKYGLRSMLGAFIVFCALAAVAIILNIVMHECAYSPGFNLFYISPYEAVNVPLVIYAYEHLPYAVYLLIYLSGFSVIAYLILLLSRAANALINRTKKEN